MKKVLVSGYIGFNNFGDEAMFYALCVHLKSLLCKVSALCNNPETVKKRYRVDTYYYKNIIQIFGAILNCDTLISGGGSLLQNKTSNRSLFYYLFIIFLAKLFNKKVIIYSQGFEPVSGALPLYFLKSVLKTVDYITVRDKKSQEYLKTLGIESEVTSDPVYSLIQDTKPSSNKKGIMVQLREVKNSKNTYIPILAKALSKYKDEEISVFSFQDKIDKKICTRFIDELKKYNIKAKLISNKTIKDTIEIINNSKYCISTRLHGLICANALNTCPFALKYDEKVHTLCEELNIDGIDIFKFSEKELDKKLDEFFANKAHEAHPYRRYYWGIIDDFIKYRGKK